MSDRSLADLPLEIDALRLEPLSLDTGGGWTRVTTVVRLCGGGVEGRGEDVTYESEAHRLLLAHRDALAVRGQWTLATLSRQLDTLALFPEPPGSPASRDYRRWAFESAALDLALRQAGRSLAAVLGRRPRPVRYVVSLGLGTPPSTAPLRRVLERYPDARFKVDYAETWTPALIDELAALGVIDVVDLKGHYRGAFEGPPADAALYRAIAERLPAVWLEDPLLDDATTPVLEPHRARVTWDAVLHSLEDLDGLPFAPRCINVKPSRFGRLAELLAVYDACEQRGIACYSGGQFELGPGRPQIQVLASLFHPDAANDTAPSEFNARTLRADLPRSPLPPPPDAPGFG